MVSFTSKAIIGAVGLGALFLIIRGAGQKIDALAENFKFPELPDVNLPSINISNPLNISNPIDQTFPNASESDKAILEKINELGGLGKLNQDAIVDILGKLTKLGTEGNPANAPTAPTPIDVILNDSSLTGEQKTQLIDIINGGTVIGDGTQESVDGTKFNPPNGTFTGKESDRAMFEAGLIDQFGRPIVESSPNTAMTENTINPIISFFKPNEPIINDNTVKIDSIGGNSAVGQQGFIINENPIDTFSEVLKFFPELTSSQAADFLKETGGKILPSQVPFVDADINNIVANVDGQNIMVDTITTPQELKTQEMISAQFTCKQFGLNCDIANGEMA